MQPARFLTRVLRFAAPAALLTSLVGTTPAAHAVVPTYPSVTITSPGATSSSAGTTAFQFTGATNPAGSDTIQSFRLVVDGSPYGGSVGCPSAGSKSCTGQLLWEAQAPNGSTATHSIQVSMLTAQSTTVLSSAVSVSATHAVATPVITAPAAGATVPNNYVTVDADASLAAPRYGDLAESMALLVDGVQQDWTACDVSTADASCPSELFWDASSADLGDHALQASLTTTSGGVWTSAVRHVTLVAAPTPVVTISSPTAGTSVSGTVSVTATGSVDGTYGDFPTDMALAVDGRYVTDSQDCPTSGPCTLTFSWSPTAYGLHTLQVDMDTWDSEALSAPVTVNVAAPTPSTVTIRLPVLLGTVLGNTVVTATGTIAATTNDLPLDMQLIVDGLPSGAAVPCNSAGSHTCTLNLPWTTTGLTGNHNIAVRFDTVKNSVTSGPREVTVTQYSQPGQTKMTLGETQAHGTYFASGIVSDRLQRPLAGVIVTVTVTPALGKPSTLSATTGADGFYSVTLGKRPSTDTVVRASLTADYGSISVSRTTYVTPVVKCTIPKTVKHGVTVKVTCSLPLVPNGVKATLRSFGKSGMHVLGHALAKKGKFAFSFVIKGKSQRLSFSVIVNPSHVFHWGASSAMTKVHVI